MLYSFSDVAWGRFAERHHGVLDATAISYVVIKCYHIAFCGQLFRLTYNPHSRLNCMSVHEHPTYVQKVKDMSNADCRVQHHQVYLCLLSETP